MVIEKTKQQILEERVRKGKVAQQVMDLYLDEFFKEREITIFTDFVNMPFDEVKLAELKRCQMALVDLKGSVLSDISIGKQAEESLETLS